MSQHIPPAVSLRLGKLVPLLGSDRDGEVLGAARAISRTLQANGRDYHDLARVLARPAMPELQPGQDDWRRMVRRCADRLAELTGPERGLVTTLQRWRGRPSVKQRAWLHAIAARLGDAP